MRECIRVHSIKYSVRVAVRLFVGEGVRDMSQLSHLWAFGGSSRAYHGRALFVSSHKDFSGLVLCRQCYKFNEGDLESSECPPRRKAARVVRAFPFKLLSFGICTETWRYQHLISRSFLFVCSLLKFVIIIMQVRESGFADQWRLLS